MQMSRNRSATVAALLTGLALLSGAGAAFASSSGSAGDDHGHVLRFRTTAVLTTVNDAGHDGPGNVAASEFDIRTRSGDEAGKEYVSCTTVTADERLCNAGFVLAGGQIEAQAAIPMTATRFTAAITGGTGLYEGVTGHITNVTIAPGVVDRTFHLLRPERD
jgi:hypothetical protein